MNNTCTSLKIKKRSFNVCAPSTSPFIDLFLFFQRKRGVLKVGKNSVSIALQTGPSNKRVV